MSTTFGQGPTGFLGVEAANPLSVQTESNTPWTVSIYFYFWTVVSSTSTGKCAVLHRSGGKWDSQHNRQSIDQPG